LDDDGVIAGENGMTYSATAEGTYTVVVTDADGCPGSATAEVSFTGCCDAVASPITSSGPFSACTGTTTSIDGTVFTSDNPSGLDYALILTDMAGNIQSSDDSDPFEFDFGGLAAGMYFVYSLSYDQTQNGMTVVNYLASLSPNTTIAQIESDISGGLCADLQYGGSGDNKVTLLETNCGTFPQGN
jgi:hypothetical protein